jgi:hypothetical protein
MGYEDMNPYDRGWLSGYNDDYPDNPFPEGTMEHAEWQEGYSDGSWEN